MILKNTDILRLLINPAFDPVFAKASRAGVASAWFGHVPFAHWLVAASRPRQIVELGTHNGVSYSAFCNAVLANNLPTHAAAIDTWQGDAQAGFYGNHVYDDFKAFHDPRYGTFSTLIRASFDDALNQFNDGSIDILHIDGEHSYAAVRHDFECWKPKLSDRGIVLLHDTQVHLDGYGVWQLWAELRQTYPGFEFEHANGLGVLGIGSCISQPVAALLTETCPDTIKRLRRRFAALGTGLQRETEVHLLKPQLEDSLTTAVNAERVAREREYAEAETAVQLKMALVEAERFRVQRDLAVQERQIILDTTLWRLTAPMRKLSSYLPAGIRQRLHSSMRWAYLRAVPVVRSNTTFGQADVPLPSSRKLTIPSAPPARFSREQVVHRTVFVSGRPDIPGNVYRVERHAAAFAAAGASVSWMRIEDTVARVDEIVRASIVIVSCAANSPIVERMVSTVRQTGALLIFDVDDLMFRPELVQTQMIEADVADYFKRVQQVLIQADACITSTDDLAIHAQRFDRLTFVLPNGFDAESLGVSRLVVRQRRSKEQSNTANIIRIGYAAGTQLIKRISRKLPVQLHA
jgi:hypothetical protein